MTITRTQKVRLYPDAIMQKVLDDLCDYRRYCWNKGLALWNDLYDARQIAFSEELKQKLKLRCQKRKVVFSESDIELLSLYPSATWQNVRDIMVNEKEDWQFSYSARTLQLAISDLGKAWKNFFDKAQPDWEKPKFKSKKAPRQGFKTDRAMIVNGKLRLDRPRGVKKADWHDISFKGAKSLEGKLTVVSIYRENGKYWASLPFTIEEINPKQKTGRKTAVDVNVGHFNYTDGIENTLPKRLNNLYDRIKHYQRSLARKRCANGKQAVKTRNYAKTRAKLQRDYRKAANLQHDIVQKFTTQLVTDYDTIVIEDLDVKHMQMSHAASKGMHRSLFSYFRQVLTYKCEWYGKKLILADRFYPSTQRCSKCGNIKQGDDKITLEGNKKHHTKHNEYICYKCGAVMDRDENAVMNLLALA